MLISARHDVTWGSPSRKHGEIKRIQLKTQWYCTNSYVCIFCPFEEYWFNFLFLFYGKSATTLSTLVSSHSPNVCLLSVWLICFATSDVILYLCMCDFFSLFIVGFTCFSSVNHILHIYVREGNIKKAICPKYKYFDTFF